MHDVRSAGRPGTGRPVLRLRPAPLVRVRRNLDHTHRSARTRRAPLRRLRHQPRPGRAAPHGAVLMHAAVLDARCRKCGRPGAVVAPARRHPVRRLPPPAQGAMRVRLGRVGQHGRTDDLLVPRLPPASMTSTTRRVSLPPARTPRPRPRHRGRGRNTPENFPHGSARREAPRIARGSRHVAPLGDRPHPGGATPSEAAMPGSRKYSWTHKRLRAAWRPIVAMGTTPCARCGERIAAGAPWDLGHSDSDRTQYNGPEHRECNRATSKHRVQRQQLPQPKRVSKW